MYSNFGIEGEKRERRTEDGNRYEGKGRYTCKYDARGLRKEHWEGSREGLNISEFEDKKKEVPSKGENRAWITLSVILLLSQSHQEWGQVGVSIFLRGAHYFRESATPIPSFSFQLSKVLKVEGIQSLLTLTISFQLYLQ